MIFIGRGVQAEKAQELTYKLTYLFAGDPLLVNAEGSHQFCNWYDLSSQWEEPAAGRKTRRGSGPQQRPVH